MRERVFACMKRDIYARAERICLCKERQACVCVRETVYACVKRDIFGRTERVCIYNKTDLPYIYTLSICVYEKRYIWKDRESMY